MTTHAFLSDQTASTHTRLPVLVAVSILLHGLVLSLVPDIHVIQPASDQGPSFNIHLVAPSKPTSSKPETSPAHPVDMGSPHKSVVETKSPITPANESSPQQLDARKYTPESRVLTQAALHDTKTSEPALAKRQSGQGKIPHQPLSSLSSSQDDTQETPRQHQQTETADKDQDQTLAPNEMPTSEQQTTALASAPAQNNNPINNDAGTKHKQRIEAAQPVVTRDSQRQLLLERIHNALAKHIEYPLRARRRGWEGEVLLAFDLSQRGHIDNIHIARSSGYSLLDNSALDAMHKVRDMQWYDKQNSIPVMDMEIPVLYRLNDG